MEPSLVGTEGSDRASESVSEVGYEVYFLLGYPISGGGSVEGGPLGDSQGSSSLSLGSPR